MEGTSVNISWTADFFPKGGFYYILHRNIGSPSIIITLKKEKVVMSAKYEYQTRPFDSVNISFKVRNITVDDAGYYFGSLSGKESLSRKGGVVLIVFGKPVKPNIKGNLEVKVGNNAYLKCESRSTSAPRFYKKFPPLSYSWFVNDIGQDRKDGETYSFTVTKDVKYNKYSCQAKEYLDSEKSDEVQINPMYGPEKVMITPQPLNDTITIKDGDPIGPYNCSADCYPSCTVQWKYKRAKGGFENITTYGVSPLSLPNLNADRTMMTLIRCVANNSEGHGKNGIKLKIQYLMDPKVYINRKLQNSFTMDEGSLLNLTCLVMGDPTPEVTLTKLTGNQILWQKQLNYTLQRDAQCSDTFNYSCEANSTEFGSRNQSFSINVHCKPRLDNSNLFKRIFGSMSGPDVNVHVSLPVIANPLTSSSRFAWSGPTQQIISIKVSQRDNVVYKHWINSTIPIRSQGSFGNYSLKYEGKVIANITINAEDKPLPPLNFTCYSYAVGFVNLTWISNFNGGPEQFFILYQKEGSSWIQDANLTDPGEGNIGHYDPGPLTPGQQYWYQLESCNRINCSLSPREVKVKVKAPPISSSALFGDNTMLVLVGASAVGFLLVVILTGAVTMYCKKTKKSAPKKRNREEGLSESTVQDDTPADVVVYAAVDKSVLLKNRQQDDVMKNDVTKDQNDDNDTMYSEVIKHPKKQQTDEKKEKKKHEEKGLQEKNEEAGASTSNDNSRSTNQDGLVYIDVEFARKPQSSDTKGRPVIHGEEEKTEYTFVDFTQKAPPVQETRKNVK
ncbi:carcinoembryonic antigen-related cell adhesion molecule 5-like [Saccostrea cucullata]|uniref:carcinoembryonic antigen-related cell adhesion molecule 5-like n=1 Tax=Saccostrea cuccullata TaxID=36930 RepID=UPI002ED39F37